MKKTIFILPLFVFAYATEWVAMPQRVLANQAQPKPETVALSSSNWDHTLDVGDTPKDIRVILPEHYQAKVTIGSTSKKDGQQAVSYKMFKGMAETVKSIPNGKVSIKVELIPLRPEVAGKPAPPYEVEMIETPWVKKRNQKKDLPVRVIVPGISTSFRALGTPSQRQNTVPDISQWPRDYENVHKARFRYMGETPTLKIHFRDAYPVTIGPGPLTIDYKEWPPYLRGKLIFSSGGRINRICEFLINYSSQQIKSEGLKPEEYTNYCNPERKVNGYVDLSLYDNRRKSSKCRPTICPNGPRLIPTRPSKYREAVRQAPLTLTYTVLWPEGKYDGPRIPVKIQ